MSLTFYGAAANPNQRTATSLHSTANVVTSASFGTLQVAQIQEIMATLKYYGLWQDN